MTAFDGFEALRVNVVHGVAWVTLDHPPINLLDEILFADLSRLVGELEQDSAIRVLVFQSADPDFFIAHADVEWILRFPDASSEQATKPNPFVQLMERIRRMPKISIGMVAGIARGGGSEFLLSLDMRFAARSKALLSQPEGALGIIPGGGGTQRLAELVGRARALEIVLGCGDIDAEEAAQIGYVNKVFADDDLLPFVRSLSERISALSPSVVRLTKEAVDAAKPAPTSGLVAETNLFNQVVALPEARNSMAAFLEAGGQTREMELRLGARIADLSRQPLVRTRAKRAS
ncbi:MAG: enoyl-CoA hydratase/isomerase family protein [Candidatus Binatia bacterium]|nr:enoyl-CoA hydratase/isomerase family protein [Candidatus Binatia bacterium]